MDLSVRQEILCEILSGVFILQLKYYVFKSSMCIAKGVQFVMLNRPLDEVTPQKRHFKLIEIVFL